MTLDCHFSALSPPSSLNKSLMEGKIWVNKFRFLMLFMFDAEISQNECNSGSQRDEEKKQEEKRESEDTERLCFRCM